MNSDLNKNIGGPVALLIAIIGCVGTCVTAILSSPLILRVVDETLFNDLPTPTSEATITVTTSPTVAPTSTDIIVTPLLPTEPVTLSIEIHGPDTAPLGKTTYYTLISQNAIRAEWSIGGFSDEIFVVDPLPPSHQIYVEPTNRERLGEPFIIAVTVYNENGNSATATKQFTIVSE